MPCTEDGTLDLVPYDRLTWAIARETGPTPTVCSSEILVDDFIALALVVGGPVAFPPTCLLPCYFF